MFHIELPRPIYLISELAPVIKASEIDLKTLIDILRNRCHVVSESGNGFRRGAVISAESLSCIPEIKTETGQEGLDIICDEYKVTPRMLESIDLPSDVYAEACPGVWPEIEHLIWSTASASERVCRLIAAGAPEIIRKNEIRILWQRIEMLTGDTRASVNAKKIPTLNTIGYSLLDGWSQSVLDRKERELHSVRKLCEKREEES